MNWYTFLALLHRDLLVSVRDLFSFLVRTLIQPAFLVVILGNVMPRLGLVKPDLTTIMLPGIIALSMLFAGMQAVAMPLIFDLGYTKEIEDRLLAPIGMRTIAVEKIVMGAFQAVLAGVAILPLGAYLMYGEVRLNFSHPVILVSVALGIAIVSAAFGLFLGALIEPQKIGLTMSVIVAPILFFGCTYYPWRGLEAVPWLQTVVLVNPLVYASEGLRAALTPEVPHMGLVGIYLGLGASMVLFVFGGIWGFCRRLTI
ncbi:MAG: ABC transporter permease [Terriglobia bacterium]